MTDATRARTARVDILVTGSPGPRCSSTCSLVRDGEAVIVIDPGLAPSPAAIVDPLAALGVDPAHAPNPAVLHASRQRVLGLADLIVPGHGAPFRPDASTPR